MRWLLFLHVVAAVLTLAAACICLSCPAAATHRAGLTSCLLACLEPAWHNAFAGQIIFRMRRPMYLINSSIYIEVGPAVLCRMQRLTSVQCGRKLVAVAPCWQFHAQAVLSAARRGAGGNAWHGAQARLVQHTALRQPEPLLAGPLMVVQDGGGNVIGEVHQRWHLWQRNYDLYISE